MLINIRRNSRWLSSTSIAPVTSLRSTASQALAVHTSCNLPGLSSPLGHVQNGRLPCRGLFPQAPSSSGQELGEQRRFRSWRSVPPITGRIIPLGLRDTPLLEAMFELVERLLPARMDGRRELQTPKFCGQKKEPMAKRENNDWGRGVGRAWGSRSLPSRVKPRRMSPGLG